VTRRLTDQERVVSWDVGQIAARDGRWETALAAFESYSGSGHCASCGRGQDRTRDRWRARCLMELGRGDELIDLCREQGTAFFHGFPEIVVEHLRREERESDAARVLADLDVAVEIRAPTDLTAVRRHLETALRLSEIDTAELIEFLRYPCEFHRQAVCDHLRANHHAAIERILSDLDGQTVEVGIDGLPWLLAETGHPAVGPWLEKQDSWFAGMSVLRWERAHTLWGEFLPR
jgi:hypothetical protein